MEKITEKRTTKAMYYENILAILKDENPPHDIEFDKLMDFIDREMEQVKRKNASGSRKSEAERAQDSINESLVLDFLRVQSEPKSVSDIWRGVPELAGETTSKVTSIVGRLLKTGAVVKSIGKNKRSLYSIA